MRQSLTARLANLRKRERFLCLVSKWRMIIYLFSPNQRQTIDPNFTGNSRMSNRATYTNTPNILLNMGDFSLWKAYSFGR